MFETGPLFLDLSNLRIGTYVGQDVVGGNLNVSYKPFTGHPFPKTVTINNIQNPNSLIVRKPIARYPGTFDIYYILLNDENGKSPFLTEDLGNKIPLILKKLDDMQKDRQIAAAAFETVQSLMSSTHKEVITDIVQKDRLLQSGSKNQGQNRENLMRGNPMHEDSF